MPQQEIFFQQTAGDRRIEVLKSYDQAYAREAFESMDDDALRRLWTSLRPEETCDPADLLSMGDPDGESFLWDELLEQAHEDGRLCHFSSSAKL